MMDILVTGGAGFVGRHLCAELARRGHSVTALDDLSNPNSGFDTPLLAHPSIRHVHAALPDPVITAEEVGRHEVIFHLAALVGVEETISKPVETVANLQQTTGLLDHVTADHRIVFASSADVYGLHSHHYGGRAMREDDLFIYEHAGVNRWVYAHVKALEESLVGASPARGVSIRLFNTYGPGMDFPNPKRVISHFIGSILADNPMKLSGTGEQTRAFCYIDDMVDGLIRAMERTATQAPDDHPCYNIGSSDPISVRELAGLCNQIAVETGLIAEPVPVVADAFQYSRGFDDSWGRIPDTTRARDELGFVARTGIADGLRQVMQHHANKSASASEVSEQIPT